MALLLYFVLFLTLTGHSSALYCLCKDGVGDQALQKAIDYACGAGADCTPILQNGACYQPNTVKDHCNYAVNSYYQRKGNVQGSCDFAGAATTSANPPTTSSGCVYPSSPGNASTTPSTGAPPGTTPTTPGTGTTSGSPNVFGMSPLSPTTTSVNNRANLEGTNAKLLLFLFVLTLCLAIRV
ncbi:PLASMODESMATA CALLOSE-BINDING PROTEIN 4 [Cajanus cajan]|uniref:Glucan endo-1,3-beta-glucosidase-like protein At1g69295 n=1 Tax=Cajanus cajan TaxID=3821 RepID=A0A151UBC2_CAJCA|nr:PLASMODESMATA CALLOSE-BINDING PROTEIN 4 [Cajanus cajan]KYP76548.1 Glucan endo-1,3-beta-glucosidase-like protein At1g69295 [Cajanus cajan]